MIILIFFFLEIVSQKITNMMRIWGSKKDQYILTPKFLQVVLPFVSSADIKINKKKLNLCSPLTNSVPVKSSEKVDEHFWFFFSEIVGQKITKMMRFEAAKRSYRFWAPKFLQVVLVSSADINMNKKKLNLCSPLTNSVPVKSSEKVDEHFWFFFRNCESENNENDENLRKQKGPIDFEPQIFTNSPSVCQ